MDLTIKPATEEQISILKELAVPFEKTVNEREARGLIKLKFRMMKAEKETIPHELYWRAKALPRMGSGF